MEQGIYGRRGAGQQYADKLVVRFTYSTNGQAIYGMDMVSGKEGDVLTYPSLDELWQMTFAVENAWRDRFAAVPFEDKGGTWGARYYRDNVINAVLEAVAANSTCSAGIGDRDALGGPSQVREVFVEFQKYLYQQAV